MAFIVSSAESERLDVTLMFLGDRFPVIVNPTLRASGWRGGLWVRYVTSTEGEFSVEVSDGNAAAGFLLFQSEDYALTPPTGTGPGSPQNWISYQPTLRSGGQNVVTMITGNTRAFFKIYETRRLVAGARTGVPIVYLLNDLLKVSENGLITNDSDVDLATVGIANPIVVGIVSAVPTTQNGTRLGADINV